MDTQLQTMAITRLGDEMEQYSRQKFAARVHFPWGGTRLNVSADEFRPPVGLRAISVSRLSRGKTPPWRFRVERSWVEFTPVTYLGKELPQTISLRPGDAFYVEVRIEWDVGNTEFDEETDEGVKSVQVWYKEGRYRILSARLIKLARGKPVPPHEAEHMCVRERLPGFGRDTWNYFCGEVTERGAFDTINGLQGHVFFVCGQCSVLPIYYP